MSKKEEWQYLILIFVIFVAACIETDIFLPALPDMMKNFFVSEGAIQGLLTWNFVGICLAGPFYGPLSDAFGRSKPLFIALAIFFLGGLVTLFSKSFDQMLIGRILQGIGSGGCFTLGTAIIFDVFTKEKAINAMNKLNLLIPIIMAGAPMLGGYLNCTFGFRSNFVAIGGCALLSLIIALLFFKEPLKKEKRVPFQIKSILKDFVFALKNTAFWQLTIITSVTFAGYIAFVSGTSVLFVVEFGVSRSIFPLFQAAILGAWMVGSLSLKRAMAQWGNQKIKKTGASLCALGGIWLAITGIVAAENPLLLTFGMMLYAFGANWIFALYFPEAMELLPHIKGVIASLLTSLRLLIAALAIGFASAIYNATSYPLIAIVIGSLILILPSLIFYEKRRVLVN